MKNKAFYIGGLIILLYLMTRKKAYKAPTIENIVDSLPTDPNQSYNRRTQADIDKIIVHHSATTSGSATAYANYHINTRGWPGIGYHFVIDKDGKINLTNYLDTISYHTAGQNTSGIGICLTGNFDVEQPTQAQLQSLDSLIQYLRKEFGNLAVFGHGDFATKSCPGNNINLSKYQNHIAAVKKQIDFEQLDEHQTCNNGTFTDNFNKGACSHNGGVESLENEIPDSEVENMFYKEFFILKFLEGNKINIDSFLEYSNKDYIKHRLNFLRKKGVPLDDAAQQLSDQTGNEITEQEIVDIIEDYPSPGAGLDDLRQRTKENQMYYVGETQTDLDVLETEINFEL